MPSLPRKLPKSAAAMRRRMNLWAPLRYAGITVTHLSPDFTRIRAKLRDCPSTKNMNGSQFGGSLLAMTDPIYSVMLHGALGNNYYVWDKSASIDFIKPGFGEVYLDCKLNYDDVERIRAETAGGQKYLPEFTVRHRPGHPRYLYPFAQRTAPLAFSGCPLCKRQPEKTSASRQPKDSP